MGGVPLIQQTQCAARGAGKAAGGCAVADVDVQVRQIGWACIGDTGGQHRGLGAFDARFVAVHCGKGGGNNFDCQIAGGNVNALSNHLRLERAGYEQE